MPAPASSAPPAATDRRVRYPQWKKDAIALRYPQCRNIKDKLALCVDLGIVNDAGEPDLARLYNLASRLKVTAVADNEARLSAAVDEAMRPERRRLREDPRSTVFTAENDRYLTTWFGRQAIEIIALQIGHTEIATAYRARQLGLRRPARHWELRRVLAWLDIDLSGLTEMGVPVLDCCDRFARVKIQLVEGEALRRALIRGGRWQRLKQLGNDIDLFFMKELIEAGLALREGAEPEALWVSHGHTCLNPLAPLSFGHFYNGDDRWISVVCELTPEETSPSQVYHHRWRAETRRY